MDTSAEEKCLDLQQALYHGTPAESRAAALELASMCEQAYEPALDMLVRALNDPRAGRDVHLSVLTAMSLLTQYISPIPQLVNFLNPRVGGDACSRQAGHLLSDYGDSPVPHLLERMRAADRLEWQWVKHALVLVQTDLVGQLLPLLAEPNGDLRIRICEVLQLRHLDGIADQVIPVLTGLLTQSDPYVRKAAARVLCGMPAKALAQLHALTTSNDVHVRALGLEIISGVISRHLDRGHYYRDGESTRPQVVPFVATLLDLQQDPAGEVRLAAAVGLQRVATALSQSQLDDELRSTDVEGQLLAARAFRENAVSPLASSLKILYSLVYESNDLRLRRQAAATLLVAVKDGAWDVKHRVIVTLSQALSDPDDPARAQYLAAAQSAGSRAMALAPAILPLVRPDEALCELAIRAIAAIRTNNEVAVRALLNCLRNSVDSGVRSAAAFALGELGEGSPEVVDALVEALGDSETGWVASEALGSIGPAANSAVPALHAAAELGHKGPEALARIGTPDAIAALWSIRNGYPHDVVLDHIGRTAAQDRYDRAGAELRRLGELVVAPQDGNL